MLQLSTALTTAPCGARARLSRLAALVILACAATLPAPANAAEGDAATLRAKYTELQPKLQNNAFQRPLHLDSTEAAGGLKGDIYAVVDYPFATVSAAFSGPGQWCDMLILHLNTKYCRPSSESGRDHLLVSVGKKHDQPLEDAYRVDFSFNPLASTPDYMNVALDAKDGPMGTSNYRILLEAVPLPDGHAFIHLTYSYAYGMAARVAMRAYLATVGSDKVGFTRTGGQGDYVGGVRGVVERNTMRYYLAIDSYLAAAKTAPAEQMDRRFQTWFAATERYARQLHEVERGEYLEMKRSEYRRQKEAR